MDGNLDLQSLQRKKDTERDYKLLLVCILASCFSDAQKIANATIVTLKNLILRPELRENPGFYQGCWDFLTYSNP